MANVQMGFSSADLNDEFFTIISQKLDLTLSSWRPATHHLSPISQAKTAIGDEQVDSGPMVGFFKFLLCGTDADGASKEVEIALKSKPNSEENAKGFVNLITDETGKASELSKRHVPGGLSLEGSPKLEVLSARHAQKDAILARYRPEVYHTLLDEKNEKFVVAMEFVGPEQYIIGGSFSYDGWDREHRFTVLTELAEFHAHFLTNKTNLTKVYGGALKKHPKRHLRAKPLWEFVTKRHSKTLPQLYSKTRLEILEKYFKNLERITRDEMRGPMTLVHNDPHSANLWIRRQPAANQSRLVLYDWENTCINVPQRDVVVFLGCNLQPAGSPELQLRAWTEYTEHYRKQLLAALSKSSADDCIRRSFEDTERFNYILDLQVFEFYCNRACNTPFLPPFLLESFPFLNLLETSLQYIEAVGPRLPFMKKTESFCQAIM